MKARRFLIAAALLALAGTACSNGSGGTTPATRHGVSGVVQSGTHAVSGASVTLYQTGQSGTGTSATAMGTARTDAHGKFFIAYKKASVSSNLYVVATGGNAGGGNNAATALAALVGAVDNLASSVTVNERSTVAFANAFAQFSDATGSVVGAPATNVRGMHYAARLDSDRLVDPGSGNPASFFPTAAQCGGSSPPENCEGLERLNALSNALAACTQSSGPASQACSALMAATGTTAKTTLAAAHALALDPSRNAGAIYALTKANGTYAPAVAANPQSWPLALKYYGNGKEFDGPGNIAIDANGNLWITNNYVYNADPTIPACGGKIVIELTPLGDDAPGAPFTGGGIDGLGWGVTFDHQSNVWVGNFGFQGKGCTVAPQDLSVSELSPSGTALSPSTGWQQGPIDRPQGMVTDSGGNIWTANFGNATVTEYRNADPAQSKAYGSLGLLHPFGEAIDASDRLWVTGQGSNNVALLQNGVPIAGSPFSAGGISRPLGDAVDMENDVWIANNGGDSVTALSSNGVPVLGSPITGGGIAVPWGVAVDGNDNVWVANFTGKAPRVSEVCGRQKRCPRGLRAGEVITPKSGFASALLQRLTAVAIDASGNVWLCDNWRRIPLQTNPGGDGVVEFVGLAGPAASPMMGPVRRP